jgi:60 kDa SS-A/Ro ribonucleoprotein
MAVRDPLASVQTGKTPQTQPVPGRTDQVKNNAGGYVFKRDDLQQLDDFLILGTTGGSYHLGEDKLTAQNATLVLDLARTAGTQVVDRVVELSTAIPARLPKNRAALFALAAVSAFGDPAAVQAVKTALPKVARTTDHLSMFFGYRKQLKGKPTARGRAPMASRAYRTTLSNWFLEGDPDNVAFRACKARQRKTPAGEAFDLRDAVRIAHPSQNALVAAAERQLLLHVPEGETAFAVEARGGAGSLPAQVAQREMLLAWLAGKKTDEQAAEVLPAVGKFTRAKAVKSPAEAIRVITELRVPWEFLPSEVLRDPGVWEVLAETTGITAVIRNLARMTRIGTLKPLSPAVSTVTRRLTDAEQLAKGRVHPMDLYLALLVYKAGISQPNPKASPEHWTPVADVLDALEEGYELSFGHVQPSGKRYIFAVDSSASMTSHAQVTQNGARLGSAYQVSNSVALTMKRIDGENVHVIEVDTVARPSKITKRTRLAEVQGWRSGGGGTDLSLPMKYAMQYDLRVDGFGLITDGETWAGDRHPVQALEDYRARFSPHARFADIAMVPNSWSQMGETPGTVNLTGLDASLPMILTGFFRNGE